MPIRIIPLATGEYYHIYNRGITKQPVFLVKKEYERFLLTLSYYRFSNPPIKLSRFLQLPKDQKQQFLIDINNREKLIEIISFVFMPNHFHFLLKQTKDNGTSTFLSRTTNSYTRYFNTKYERIGPLFQGAFKAVRVETDDQLIHLSRYIHLNPLVSYVVKDSDFLFYPWSSLPDFLNNKSSLVNIETLLAYFPNSEAYKNFILDQVDYARKLEEIKHLLLEK